MSTTQPAEVTEEVKGTVKFGTGQIGAPTPLFATWIFRIVLWVASLGNIGIISFTSMKPQTKLKIVEASSFVTLAVHSASKMFGIQIPDYSQQNNKQ